MSTIFLIVSTISFIATWGIHMLAKNGVFGYNSYLFVPWRCAIPWISGFGLAVIPYDKFTTPWHWIGFILICIIGLGIIFFGAHLFNKYLEKKRK